MLCSHADNLGYTTGRLIVMLKYVDLKRVWFEFVMMIKGVGIHGHHFVNQFLLPFQLRQNQ